MIPVNEPLISKKAQKYVLDCLASGYVSSTGKFIGAFEKRFARYIGTKYATTTTSGTTALHLALATLGIGKGDEVILPDLTIISCAYAVLLTGARPVFIDVEKRSGNIDPLLIEKKITKKTKAIMAVHLYSIPSNMEALEQIAKKYKLFIIEDAAEALGSEYKGKKVGSIGTIGCFSFYGNKLVTTGEGGMLVTNSKKLHERAKSLKNLSHTLQKRFLHEEMGFNYRMSNLQAALGLSQLEEIEGFVKKKHLLAKMYTEGLKDIPYLDLPEDIPGCTIVPWMYTLKVKKSSPFSRDQVVLKLKKLGIETRNFFIPMHQQPVIKKMRIINSNEKFPISNDLSKRGFYLPSGLAITEKQITKVIGAVYHVFK